jgi:hypothetical protein
VSPQLLPMHLRRAADAYCTLRYTDQLRAQLSAALLSALSLQLSQSALRGGCCILYAALD